MLLDRAVLPLGRMELLPDCDGVAAEGDGGDGRADAKSEFVRMDASALENLEVRANMPVAFGSSPITTVTVLLRRTKRTASINPGPR